MFDDLLLLEASQLRRNWQMALHAAHLATGSTLMCKSIKSGTIKACLLAVGGFCARFPRWLEGEVFNNDPRHCHQSDKNMCTVLKSVIDEVARWEKQPRRREPFTIPMWKELDRVAAVQDRNDLFSVCRDFFGCALHAGF